jgi:uncharacterized 2Fe-2S/4Fe-4S cluster protein (DUF4445 family)
MRCDMTVSIPRLMTKPKVAMFGVGRQVLLDPNVHKLHVALEPPELHDQRSDVQRLKEALREEGFALSLDLPVLRTLPGALRKAEFDVTAVLCGETLLGVEPGDTSREAYGIAFDLGTTTIVGTLLDLATGEARGVESALNAQAMHGGDVLSRISHTMSRPEGLEELQHLAAITINGIIEKLCTQTGTPVERIYEMTIAGNATMLHLLMGIDPEPISVAPFIPASDDGVSLTAADLGIRIHPRGQVYLFPDIGAYVGGDIVAGLLATTLPRGSDLRLFVDVGTNGEIALGWDQRTVCTAAPAGPAFEGAEISCGMRATTGAIEGVRITQDAVELATIDDAPPQGLCGSGLIDTVAQLYGRGLLDATGRLRSADEVGRGAGRRSRVPHLQAGDRRWRARLHSGDGGGVRREAGPVFAEGHPTDAVRQGLDRDRYSGADEHHGGQVGGPPRDPPGRRLRLLHPPGISPRHRPRSRRAARSHSRHRQRRRRGREDRPAVVP